MVFFAFSCDSDKITGEVTGCGGSFDERLTIKTNNLVQEENKCYNTLKWKYNKDNKKVTFIDEKAPFNCCGSRSITAFEEGDLYVLKETEKDGYCDCTCSYSFLIEVPNVNEETINVELRRKSNNSDDATILNTPINLSEGEGAITIREVRCMD
jgi:hypothetical protein